MPTATQRWQQLDSCGRTYRYASITGLPGAETLPYSLKVLLENVLRTCADDDQRERAVDALISWDETAQPSAEIPFSPARVLMQDMAGATVVHDLVTLREGMRRLGGDPAAINPLIPGELVIDHSVIVDHAGFAGARARNEDIEFERNKERYQFLRWAQTALDNFKVVPPGVGIVHQVNMEHLTRGIMTQDVDGATLAFPDTCIGTDSHTTMVNGLGVLGWGVGGIEATAALLGQASSLLIPRVVGVELTGRAPAGTTSTDVVLRLTQMLREHGVVGKIVEFHGLGLAELPVAHRATISNMSPEFGSTAAMFPVDAHTLDYFRLTGRPDEQVSLIEDYARAQGLWADDSSPTARYSERLTLDLATIVPSIAGPRRPQDRIDLDRAGEQFRADAHQYRVPDAPPHELADGSIAIAAITSCTNTANPSVMMAAGLLARNAVERGLSVPAWVKTSMAPGSQAVTRYLSDAGLTPALDALGFQVVGYGCTTCMGNSGPLDPAMSRAAQDGLLLTSVLSGNRNFEGRIHADVRMNYLASPPLVIAYALAGTMDVDLTRDPLGHDADGNPVHLPDLWPSPAEVDDALSAVLHGDLYEESYRDPFSGSRLWQELDVPEGEVFTFDETSSYLRSSPFLDGVGPRPAAPTDIRGARVLVKLGDSVTTDHISPVGSIQAASPAGQYLAGLGVARGDFNSYGSRRGNHEVMVRGTFANVRLRNHLVGQEGGVTRTFPDGEVRSIFDAAQHYAQEDTPLLVLAGREYGSGSARDYAAKGTMLLGVKAVLAESFERIHRANLVGMGVVPLEFLPRQNADTLGLDGSEEYSVEGLAGFADGRPERVLVTAIGHGREVQFEARVRIDTATEAEYYRHGGILPYVVRTAWAAPRE